jgi:tetratricopeptide (TPR) repeat protein
MSRIRIILMLWIGIFFSPGFSPAMTKQSLDPYQLHYNDALLYIKQVVNKNPQNYKLRFVLGSIYFRIAEEEDIIEDKFNLLTKAEKEFILVTKQNDKEYRAYYYLGLIESLKGDRFKNAKDYFLKAKEINCNDVRVFIKLAMVEAKLNKQAKAIELLEDAKRTFNGSYDIYNLLSVLYLMRQEYEKVIENGTRALTFKKDTQPMLTVASAYSRTGKYDNAILLLKEVLSMDAGNRTALLGLTIVLKKKGDINAAINILKDALEFYPDDPQFKKLLSEIENNDGI